MLAGVRGQVVLVGRGAVADREQVVPAPDPELGVNWQAAVLVDGQVDGVRVIVDLRRSVSEDS
jgi:hypothetical protein